MTSSQFLTLKAYIIEMIISIAAIGLRSVYLVAHEWYKFGRNVTSRCGFGSSGIYGVSFGDGFHSYPQTIISEITYCSGNKISLRQGLTLPRSYSPVLQ
jgi:hypothetical protein